MLELIKRIAELMDSKKRLYIQNLPLDKAQFIQRELKDHNGYKICIIDKASKIAYAYASSQFWQTHTLFIYCEGFEPCGGMKRQATEIKE
ncbi:hypothetical protein J7384_17125 [Endozoicomonas sp. G2_1]|uniref:hypothetical protein n=1 Tax=Endozoicomonas sp. G2_1 TaxID=2821091 RepID=UPI001ADBAEA5|nr:hypothetical protein [Endozoicomonas sp. G2_1]MBO9492087.1 hypothetical protein [Endozoicomonas sp. G2_1]